MEEASSMEDVLISDDRSSDPTLLTEPTEILSRDNIPLDLKEGNKDLEKELIPDDASVVNSQDCFEKEDHKVLIEEPTGYIDQERFAEIQILSWFI